MSRIQKGFLWALRESMAEYLKELIRVASQIVSVNEVNPHAPKMMTHEHVNAAAALKKIPVVSLR